MNARQSLMAILGFILPRRSSRPGSPRAAYARCVMEAMEQRTLLSAVYVDATWAGMTPGATVSGHTFGTDAFATIQDGVNAAGAGDTVHVQAGTYIENVTVNKAVEIAGAGQGQTVIMPAFVGADTGGGSLTPGSSNVMLVQHSDVTIDNLTVDGANPSLTGGVTAGGVSIDARNGIITDHTLGPVFDNLVVHDVTVQNVYLRGIYASTGGTFNFSNNTVTNVQADPSSVAIYNFGGSGIIQNNTVSNSTDAISANWSAGTQFLGNTITNSGSGVHTDNAQAADMIQGNVVTDSSYGVWAFSPYATITIDHNNMTDVATGLAAFGSAGGTVDFTNNTVTNSSVVSGSVGAYVSTSLLGYGDAAITATFKGNTITNAETGMYIESTGGMLPTVTVTGGAITGGTTGIDIEGGSAAIDSNTFSGNALDLKVGASGTVSSLTNDTFTGVEYINNQASAGIDATTDKFGGATVGTLTVDAANLPTFYAVEDKITDALDQSGLGLVRLTANNVYVTQASAGIQRGVDAATAGDTVNVQAGTYGEQLTIAKSLTLVGAGAGQTIIQAPATLTNSFTTTGSNKAIVYVNNTASVTIQNLTVDGNLNGNGNDLFEGIAFYQAGGKIDTVEVKNITGGQNGYGIYAAADNGTTRNLEVQGSTVDAFQKNGMVFSGQNLTVNVHGNSVAGAGDSSSIAQNGIEVLEGASGTIGGTHTADGNSITNLSYTGTAWAADVGILAANAGTLTISHNSINLGSTNASLGSNAIVVQVGDTTPASLPAPTITDNTIVGNNYGDSAIFTDGPATITGNALTGKFSSGIMVANEAGSPFWIPGASATVTGNIITGSGAYTDGNFSTGITVSGPATIDSNTVTQAWYGIAISAASGESLTVTNNQLSGSGGGYSVGLSVQDTPATAHVTLGGNYYATTLDNYIVLSYYLGDTGSTVNLDATGEYFDASYVAGTGGANDTVTGGTSAGSGTLAEQFAFADKIVDGVDFSGLGLVRTTTDNVYVAHSLSPYASALGATAPSIQRGIDAATTGDTVNVQAGTYDEHVDISKAITLRGANADSNPNTAARSAETIIDGQQIDAPLAIDASNVTVNGFTIQGGLNGRNAGIAMSSSTSGVDIQDNIITNNTIGIYANSSDSSTIQDNLITANNLPGPAGGTGIYAEYTNNLTIDSNVITGQTDNNPVLFGATAAGVHQNLRFTNNTLDNPVAASAVYAVGISGGVFSGNDITTEGQATGIRLGGADANISVSHNNIHGVYRGIGVLDDGYGLGANSAITVNNNSITGVSGAPALEVDGSYPGTLDATNNWWGTIDAAAVATQISGAVSYDPWVGKVNISSGGSGTLTFDPVASPAVLNDFVQASSDTTDQPPVVVTATDQVTLSAIVTQLASVAPPANPVTINLDLGNGSYNGMTVDVPHNVTLVINGQGGTVTVHGHSPALVVNGGDVLVCNGVTLVTATDSPTVLVTGGTLTLQGSTVTETSGGNRAAIEVDSGGTLVLDNSTPNTINIQGPGRFLDYAAAAPLSAVGTIFQQDGTTLTSNYAIEDGITDGLDQAGVGVVRIAAGNVFVTQASETASAGAIQRGIDAAAAGDTVNVQAGTYAENVVINKALTLQGAQAGNDANARAAAFVAGKADPAVETIVTPSSVNPGSGRLIRVTADNVTIDGLVLDGNNAALTTTGADQINGVGPAIDARNGIDTYNGSGYQAVNNLTVQDNIVQNVDHNGIAVLNPTDGSAITSGNVVTGNVLQNFLDYGVVLAYNAYGDVTGNTITAPDYAEAGVWIYDFTASGGTTATQTVNVSSNNITVSQDGYGAIWANLLHPNSAGTSTLNITNNIVNGAADVANDAPVFGIYLTSFDGNMGASITGNTVGVTGGQLAAGISIWNAPTTSALAISGGAIDNATVGINLDNVDPSFGSALGTTTVSVSGVTINDATTGILIHGDGSGGSSAVNIGSGNHIAGGTTGISIDGANTALVGNTISTTTLSGQSGDYITLANGALAGQAINAAGASFDALSRSSVVDMYAAENKITDVVDQAGLGLVQIKAGSAFVTAASESTNAGAIGRAESLAAPGANIYVQGTLAFTLTTTTSITYGTANITPSGTISATNGGLTYVLPAGGQVAVSIADNNASATPAISSGAFTGATLDTHNLPVAGSPHAVAYAYSAAYNVQFDTVTGNTGSLTVTPKALTLTADAQSAVYGAGAPALTYTPTGLINGDTVTTAPTLGTAVDGTTGVGGYAITISGGDAGANYTITDVGNTLTVTPKSLTLTADAQSAVYGVGAPTLTYTPTGLINGDTVTTAPTLGTAVDTTTGVGHYAITISGGSAGANYTVSDVAGTLTVTPAGLTVTADAKTKVYGAADPVLTYQITGGALVNGDTLSGTLSRAGGPHVGSYSIGQGSVTAGSNYAITYVPANLTITPATLTITADSKSKVYGAALPTLTSTIGGLVTGDSLSVGPTLTTLANAGSGVGHYTITASGADAGTDYTIDYVTGTLTVTAVDLTVTADAGQSKIYGQTDPALTYTLTGTLVGTDTLTGNLIRAAGQDVGTYAIGQGTVSAGGNYAITYVGADFSITQKSLTVTADAGQTKVYGQTDPALTYTLTGTLVGTDTLSGSLTRAAGQDVGTYAIGQGTVSASNNYAITYVAADFAITPQSLTITADTQTKVYGAAVPTLTATVSGLVGTDVLLTDPVLSTLATDTSPVSGSPYVITVSGAAASTNYSITYVDGALTVTPAALTITADAGQTKVYGQTDPALTYTLTGTLVGTDTLTGNLTRAVGQIVGTYAIGQGTVSAGSNYAITYVGADFAITPKALTVTITASDKVYDTTVAATDTPTLTGVLGSDAVTLIDGTATFSDKNVGGGKLVTDSGISVTGADAGNYSVNATATTHAAITPASLNVTITASDKVYDATPAATDTPTLTGVQGSDAVTLVDGTATFDTKTIGTGKLVTDSGISVIGADAGNYSVNATATTHAAITPASLNVTITASDKVYDTTTAATDTPTLTGVLGTDDVTLVDGTATFASQTVGTGKLVTDSGITITGADAGNYTFNSTATTHAAITPASLNVTITASDKVYDTTSAATDTPTLSGVLGSDAVTLIDGTATFANKNVGGSKLVTDSGISVTGADAGNYTFNSTATTHAAITPASLLVTITASDKVYDATPAATDTPTLTGVLGSDAVTLVDGTATFNTKNIGTGKLVTDSGISVTGTDGGNYTVNSTATTHAAITAAGLTVTITASDKVYDTTTAATDTPTLTGVLGSDAVTLVDGTATFANKTVGSGKLVTDSGISITGADAGNYTFNSTATTHAAITPATLTVTITASDKVYDTTTAATYTPTLTGVLGSDAVTLVDGTATFSDKNVGGSKLVTDSGISVTGADAGNYSVNATATTHAAITPASLTVTITASDKAYDGTTAATDTPTLTGVLGSDDVTLVDGTATFDTKNIGTGKLVTDSGIHVSGADAGNYTVNSTATTHAAITGIVLTVTITADNKIYDGTTAATDHPTLAGVQGSDAVTLVDGTATFADRNVGTGKLVTDTGITITGADAGNYTVNAVATTHADITARALTVTANTDNRVYNGWNTSTVIPTITSGTVVSGDTAAFSETFDTKHVGSGKVLTPAGLVLDGNGGNNYAVTFVTDSTGVITPADLTLQADNKYKPYGAVPSLTTTYIGLQGPDTPADMTVAPTLTTTATATDHVSITPFPIHIFGAVNTDYNISYVDGLLWVVKAPLTITADNKIKIVDAPVPTLTASYSGFVLGEDPTVLTNPVVLATTATASSHMAGNPYPIYVSGATAADYAITFVNGTLTVILPVQTLQDEVNTSDGLISLREAIAMAAPSGDTITFDPALTAGGPATINLSLGELDIAKNVTIQGPGASLLTVSGNNTDRVFQVDSSTVAVTGLTIANGNSTNNYGGGFYNNGGTLTLSNDTLSGDAAHYGGGGVYNLGGVLSASGTTFSGDSTSIFGGGIYNNGGSVSLSNDTFTGNSAGQNGGAVYSSSGPLTITGSTISGNTAVSYGGGVGASYSNGGITNTTLSGNTAGQFGGGFYADHSTQVLYGVTLSGNTASNQGGGLYTSNSTLTAINSTVAGNSAVYGGGILTYYSTLNLTNDTIASNTASTAGGGIYNQGLGTTLANNTIVAANSVGNIAGDFGLSGSHNLTSGNPLLGALANNGGPTQTMAILAGSPAIDAGSNALALDANSLPLTSDQRGQARVQDGDNIGIAIVDIGAYEYGGGGGGANQPPVANAGGPYTIAEGQSLHVSAAASTDPDHDTLTYSWDINGDGTFGDATGVSPTLTWAQLQALGITDGPASRTVAVRVNDGHGHTVTATSSLTVTNVPPTAVADAYNANENQALHVAAPGVLANDTDPGSHALSALLVTGPTNGTLTLQLNGSFTYTPNTNFVGIDQFSYQPSDGVASGAVALVTLTVQATTPINTPPTLDLDTTQAGTGSSATFTGGGAPVVATSPNVQVTAAGSTLQSATITLASRPDGTAESLAATTTGTSITASYDPATGILQLNGTDTLAHYQQVLDTVTYSDTAANPSLVDRSISFVVNDGQNNSPAAVAVVHLLPTPGPQLVVTTLNDVVNPTDGLTSLREAIAAANPSGDTITFVPALTGTLNLTLGELDIAKSLTIQGPGAGVITISGQNANRVFAITGSTVAVTGLTIANGSALNDYGGAFYNNGGTLTLSNDVLSGDTAHYGGGAVYNLAGALAVSNSTFSGDSTSLFGGAIYNNGGSVNLTQATMTGNSAGQGGGALYSGYGTFAIASSTLSTNSATSYGGGVYALYSTGSVNNSTLSGNTAGNYGGGLYNDHSTVVVTNTTLAGNAANLQGGGVYNTSTTLTLINDTLTGNTAAYGGGILNSYSTLNLTNDTISANTASTQGGGIYTQGVGTVLTNNTILSGNHLGAVNNDVYGDYGLTGGYNLIGVGGGLVNGVNGNIVGVTNPQLGALQDNGGPTYTMGLLGGSPAIDAGSNALALDANGQTLASDQRGQPRIQDGDANGIATVDVGAFEDGGGLNQAPVANAGGPYSILEGQSVTLNATASSDADHDPLTYQWDVNGDGNFNDATGVSPTLTWAQLQALGITDGPATRNVAVRVNDGHGHIVTSASTTLTVANVVPTAVADSYSLNQDQTLTVAAPGIVGNDIDPGAHALLASLVTGPTHGTLTLNSTGAFVYTPDAGYVGSDQFTYQITDGVSTSDPGTVSLTVKLFNPVNVPPAVDLDSTQAGTGYTTTFTGGGGAVHATSANVSVTDTDSTLLQSATITLTNRPDGTAEVLAADTTGTPITASYDPTTGVLQLTGAATPAQYQQVLGTVTYNNTAAQPNLTDRTITFVANDGQDNSATAVATLHVLPPAGAQPLIVTTLNDVVDPTDGLTSLREAIALAAASGDTITFDPALTTNGPGTINLTLGELDVAKNVTILGPGANLLTLSGGNTTRVFNIEGSTVMVNGLTVANANASAQYGGAFNNDHGTLTLNNDVLSGNFANYGGGGVYNLYGVVTATGTTFTGGSTNRFGGGLYNNSGSVTLTGDTFTGNSASQDGGAVYSANGPITVSSSSITGNTAGSYGGGVGLSYSNGSITNTTIAGNHAGQYGGGLYADHSSQVLYGVTLSGNTAANQGGGVYVSNSTMTIINSTLAGNTTVYGGGIMTYYSTLNLTNDTIATNTASTTGGGIYNQGMGMTLANNTIISANSVGDVAGDFALTGSHNLVGGSALLGPLSNNGGPTQTLALLAGSPAIDAGSNALAVDASGNPLATDQRGSTRIITNVVDIGAYEFGAAQQQYLTHLYNDLLLRAPDPAGLNAWTSVLAQGASYQQVATDITSSREYDGIVVDKFYVQYLGRHAEDWGLQQWIDRMQAGYNAEAIRAGILGSAEYFQDTGGTNGTFVTALYSSFLGRVPDTGGYADWTAILDTGADTRQDVASRISNSDENRTDIITGFYQTYMLRAPDPSGLADWKTLLADGVSQPAIITAFVTSPEYLQDNLPL